MDFSKENYPKILAELLTYPVVARYEVIADFPGNQINTGEIIELRLGPDERFKNTPYAYTENGAKIAWDLDRYPHLYKKLKI